MLWNAGRAFFTVDTLSVVRPVTGLFADGKRTGHAQARGTSVTRREILLLSAVLMDGHLEIGRCERKRVLR